MNDIQRAARIRKNIFLMAHYGNTGHLASAFSMVEILCALYFGDVMRYDPRSPQWEGRDKLIMSKGQGALALYAVLIEAGILDASIMRTFSRPGSSLGGEPLMGDVPGVESSSGSLGHGLPFAAGAAMGYKLRKMDNHVYCIIGDGECQEGSIWEVAQSAAHFKLDNLTVIMDDNKLQAMDTVEAILGPVDWMKTWSSFGWNVVSVDGHDTDAVRNALRTHTANERPTMIIANTIKGKGVSFMENVPIWHFRMPNADELKIVMRELDISEEELA